MSPNISDIKEIKKEKPLLFSSFLDNQRFPVYRVHSDPKLKIRYTEISRVISWASKTQDL